MKVIMITIFLIFSSSFPCIPTGATALQTLIGDASDITVRKRVEQCFSCERVLALSQCGHGSHVVRKLLSAWTADETAFLFPLMRANLATIACSKYGTVVLQRLIDALVAEDVVVSLVIRFCKKSKFRRIVRICKCGLFKRRPRKNESTSFRDSFLHHRLRRC